MTVVLWTDVVGVLHRLEQDLALDVDRKGDGPGRERTSTPASQEGDELVSGQHIGRECLHRLGSRPAERSGSLGEEGGGREGAGELATYSRLSEPRACILDRADDRGSGWRETRWEESSPKDEDHMTHIKQQKHHQLHDHS